MATLFTALQHVIPQHALSRLIGMLAETQNPTIKNRLIRQFIRHYGVDMSEAEIENPDEFSCFNDFFTRALKSGARKICEDEHQMVSPVDGCISQIGDIRQGRIIQAKGKDYSVQSLLGDKLSLATEFNQGTFATIYLAPKDYHRIHMPISGRLIKSQYVPGKLFSVNPTTADNVPELFARNERFNAVFEHETLGPFAMSLVGAMIVASIETTWSGLVAPDRSDRLIETTYDDSSNICIEKGAEMGRFRLGSTVILLFPEGTMRWSEALRPSATVRMGEAIAEMI